MNLARGLRTTAGCELLVVVRPIPAARPMPDVSCHVKEAVTVRQHRATGAMPT
jgi:hypothetical protein